MTPKTIVILLLLLIATSTCGCTGKMSTYTQDGTENRLELRSNDHFTIHQSDGFSGIWCADGDSLKLHPLAGGELTLTKAGRDYIDADGDRWVRT